MKLYNPICARHLLVTSQSRGQADLDPCLERGHLLLQRALLRLCPQALILPHLSYLMLSGLHRSQ